MADNSSTVPKQLTPFVKGDPRINRKGRPKTFDAARELAQQIAHEEARLKTKDDGTPGDPVIVNGHRATVIEMIMRQWATSKVPALQQAFVEYAYGKPPTKTEITGANGGPVLVKGYVIISPDDWEKAGGGDGE